MGKFIDLTGQRFGRLTVLERVSKIGERVRYKCRCDCGNITTVDIGNLTSGATTSCGCKAREALGLRVRTHGSSDSRLYKIWLGIKKRCNNPKFIEYHCYGGRGITVCSEWENSFESFREWALTNGYTDKLSIDRIDTDKEYSPGNCRWSTATTQNRNRRNNRLITYNGQTKCLADWADAFEISYKCVHHRLSRGWSIEEALTIPPGGKRKKL